MIRTIQQLFTDATLYECRNCGTTLESDENACPACDSEEIAEYESALLR